MAGSNLPVDIKTRQHTLVQFTTQQLALLVVQTSLTDRDNRFDRHGEDQRVHVRIVITITLSW
jgi:hypothetical protein